MHLERRRDGRLYAREKGMESLLAARSLAEPSPSTYPASIASSTPARSASSSQSNPLTQPPTQTQSLPTPPTLPPPLTQPDRPHSMLPRPVNATAATALEQVPSESNTNIRAQADVGQGTNSFIAVPGQSAFIDFVLQETTRDLANDQPNDDLSAGPGSGLGSSLTTGSDQGSISNSKQSQPVPPSSSTSGSASGSQGTRPNTHGSTASSSLPGSHPCETFEDGRDGKVLSSLNAVPLEYSGPSEEGSPPSSRDETKSRAFGAFASARFRPFGFGSAMERPPGGTGGTGTGIGSDRSEGAQKHVGGNASGQTSMTASAVPVPISPIFGGFARGGGVSAGIAPSFGAQQEMRGQKRSREEITGTRVEGIAPTAMPPTEEEARKSVRFGFGNSPAGVKRS